jgi:uroporphyrinogen-III synthase
MKKIYLLTQNTNQYENVEYLTVFDIQNISYKIDFSLYDGLIFTSKNGVYSLQNDTKSKTIPAYAIASKTAEILNKNKINVVYTGTSGHGDDFAKELIPILKNKKVLYIRAKKVVSNLTNILNDNGVCCDELITYQTVCKKYNKTQQPPKNSIIIFSSPSTIKCFFESFKWDNSYLAISIGKTTAKYFPNDIKYKIAKQTSIQSCIELAQRI